MLRALYTGITGIRNHQLKLDVVANNIANANTIGYKRGRVTFEDTLSQTLRGAFRPQGSFAGMNPLQVGQGVQVAAIDKLFAQGNLESTGQLTDLALQGDGFFIVSDGSEQYYTRAGAFQIDAQGYLLAQGGGMYLQGLTAAADGSLPEVSNLGNIRLPLTEKTPAKATTEVGFYCNLNASATSADAVEDLELVGDTGITSISGTARDGIGGTHTLTITGEAGTRSTFTGTNATGQPLTGDLTLESLGSRMSPVWLLPWTAARP